MKSLLFQVIVIEVLALPFTDAQSLPCSVDSGGVCSDVVCPGDVVTYTCTLPQVLGSTLWTLPEGHCDENVVPLTQETGCSNSAGTCGPFEVANQPAVGGQCLVSTLTVTASLDISNSLIQCTNDPTGDPTPILVGNTTLLVTGPPSVSSVSVASCTVDSVTLVWEDTSSVPTHYVLSATPTVLNCEPSCTVSSPTMEYTFTGLEGGESYSVAVQADNCNGIQQGEEVTVDVSLSDVGSLSLNVCPTYDGSTNTLESVEATWNYLDPVVAMPGGRECASVMEYELMLNDVKATILPSECMSDRCTYSTNETFGTASVNVTLMAVEVNAEEKRNISTTNNLMSVNINAISPPVMMATCSFLSGFTGDALCRVDFTGPDGVTYTSVSTERGSAGESVTVELTLNGEALLPNTNYSYLATVEDSSPCVRVTGQFTTGEYTIDCTEDPLGISDTSVCGAGQTAVNIPNGMLSCDGLTPGSTATFTCDNGSSVVLECQLNGAWDKDAPTCEAVSSGLSTGAIVGIAIGVLLLLLLIGAVTGLLVWCLCCYRDTPKKEKQRKKEDAKYMTTGTLSTSPDSGGAKADDQVEMEENIAYEKVKGFKLTENVAYMTTQSCTLNS